MGQGIVFYPECLILIHCLIFVFPIFTNKYEKDKKVEKTKEGLFIAL